MHFPLNYPHIAKFAHAGLDKAWCLDAGEEAGHSKRDAVNNRDILDAIVQVQESRLYVSLDVATFQQVLLVQGVACFPERLCRIHGALSNSNATQ